MKLFALKLLYTIALVLASAFILMQVSDDLLSKGWSYSQAIGASYALWAAGMMLNLDKSLREMK